jgi:hypothetical protein
MHVSQNDRGGQSDLAALRELLFEAIAKAKPGIDIAGVPCKDLVQRIINARGEQAAAVLATKLNAELARRGKGRVMLRRAARNGNGVHVHG